MHHEVDPLLPEELGPVRRADVGDRVLDACELLLRRRRLEVGRDDL
jgi:hypothetical protein